MLKYALFLLAALSLRADTITDTPAFQWNSDALVTHNNAFYSNAYFTPDTNGLDTRWSAVSISGTLQATSYSAQRTFTLSYSIDLALTNAFTLSGALPNCAEIGPCGGALATWTASASILEGGIDTVLACDSFAGSRSSASGTFNPIVLSVSEANACDGILGPGNYTLLQTFTSTLRTSSWAGANVAVAFTSDLSDPPSEVPEPKWVGIGLVLCGTYYTSRRKRAS